MNSKTNNIQLLMISIIILLAFVIRIKGIWFGYPLATHPDEPRIVNTALQMLQTGDLNPHFFNYPTLIIYVQALLSAVTIFVLKIFAGMSAQEIPVVWFHIVGRAYNVLLASASVFLVWDIGRKLLSDTAGLAAAAFLAVAYLHVSNSYLITVDVSVALWTLLAVSMAAHIFTRGPALRYYLWGGVFVGLAIGSKYTAFVAMAPLLLAHFLSGGPARDQRLWLCLSIAPLVFLLTTPFALLDMQNFIVALQYESNHYRTGHPGFEAQGQMSFELYLRYLLSPGFGILPTLMSILGLLWMMVSKRREALLLLSAPLLLFLFVGQYKVFFPRNIVAVIPFLSIFSGVVFHIVYQQIRAYRGTDIASVITGFVLVVCVWSPTIDAFQHTQAVSLPDTRVISQNWAIKNLPPGSTVGREHYTPPLEDHSDAFQVFPLGSFAVVKVLERVLEQDYMIVSEADYGRYVDEPERYPDEARRYEEFFDSHVLIHETTASLETNGPTIRIYKLNGD